MPELIHILPILGLCFALAAVIISWYAVRVSGTHNQNKINRAMIEQIEDLQADVIRLNGQWKKLNANYASLKAKGKNQHTNGESDDSGVDTSRRMDESDVMHKERLREIARRRGLYGGE